MRNAVSRILRLCPGLACVMCMTALTAQTAPPAQSPNPAATPAAPQSQPQTAPAQTPGQAPNTPDQNGTLTIRVPVNEVYLEFVVSDRHGHFIKDLKQSDFALLDDHKAPAQVYSFTQETNLPLRVGILIDTSTSIRSRFQFEQQAATAFLLSILRPASDKAFVEGFDVTPDYRQDWSNDMDALTRGIDALRPGGGTALYDAVYSA
jgi:Ca-activated chloride channel homolog